MRSRHSYDNSQLFLVHFLTELTTDDNILTIIFVHMTDLSGEGASLAVMINHLVTAQVTIVNDITLQHPEERWVGVAQHS